MQNEQTLGIIGGMGPLASAEFLKSIYEYQSQKPEQETSKIILYSNPEVPDRTEEIRKGSHKDLLMHLNRSIEYLNAFKVNEIILCCITMHYIIPYLEKEKSDKIVSLVENIFKSVLQVKEPTVLICTNGTREVYLFQTHPEWKSVHPYIVLPDMADQEEIHYMIYSSVKKNTGFHRFITYIEYLLTKYNSHSFIAGCTEMHLLTKHLKQVGYAQKQYRWIDPLDTMAREIANRSIQDIK